MRERDSNIELLRIVATLFILIVHCNGWFLREWGGVSWLTGGYAIGSARIIIQNISCIGVILFVLISGFYGIRPKLKSIVNLFTLLLFFYVGCYLLNCYIGNEIFVWKRLLKSCLVFSRENWFINCYLFLMLLAPIINAFMENTAVRNARIYLTIFLICAFYWGCISPSTYFYFNGGYSVTTMVLIYMIGRYMNIHVKEQIKKQKYSHLVLAYIISLLILIAVFCIEQKTGRPLTCYCSPFSIASAVCFFWLFYKMPIPSNPAINWIGKSCLACFIFHTCQPIIGWFASKDVTIFQNNSFLFYCGKMALMIIGVFIISIMLDKIRITVFKPVVNWAGKIKELN